MLYLLDTNILIDWFAGGSGQNLILKRLEEPGSQLATAWICAAEFLVKARAKEEKALFNIIQSNDLQLLELTGTETLSLVAEIRQKTQLPLPDTMILATAKHHHATLLTQDQVFLRKAKKYYSKVRSS